MTYKQMTEKIEQIPKQIAYLYNVRDTHYKGNKEIADMTCDIVNNLCAYQNYLKFEKEYKDKTLADMELRQCKREASKQEVKRGKWTKDFAKRRGDGEIYDYMCNICGTPATESGYGNCDIFSPYCPNCGAKMDGKE